MGLKIPFSVLVVVHTPELEVLLIERAARPGWWQSVTGSLERVDEPPRDAALRELHEETGIEAGAGRLTRWPLAYTFSVFPEWRHRFLPGTVCNTEYLFSFELASRRPVTLAADEHTASAWLPWAQAVSRCFSWTNRDAIRMLAARATGT